MTTLQVLCRYEDDPSVGNFWVTMDELANALSALQTTVPDGADDAQDDAPPPKYSTYKWRVEAIGGHHDNWTYAALYACDAIPVSGDTHKRVLDALAAMTTRAERAERLIEDLTPGGSEFHGSPARCAEFVRNRMAGVIEQVKLRQAAEAKLETAITRAGQFEARLDDAQMDIARLCGLLRGVRYVNTVGDIQRLVRACEAVEARWGIKPQAVQP